ncbi:MAG: hypothetical protein ACYTHM_02145 [Planctomycetota bacterium]|jgi:hypothetical protein
MTGYPREEKTNVLVVLFGLGVLAATVGGNFGFVTYTTKNPEAVPRLVGFFCTNFLTFFFLSLGFYLVGSLWGERMRLISTGVFALVFSLVIAYIDYVIIYGIVQNPLLRK